MAYLENITSLCWNISTNLTIAEEQRERLTYGPLDVFLITSFMPTILAIGLVGNLAFLLVVFRVPWMRTVTNRYLTNLAVADITFLISSVSHSLWQFYGSNGIYNEVFLGVAGCVTLPTLSDIAHLASISFVTLVSIERYYAVCKPHAHSQSTVRQHNLLLIVTSWLGAVIIALVLNIPSRKNLSSFCVIWPDEENVANLPRAFGYCGPVQDTPWVIKAVNFFQTVPYFTSFVVNACIYALVIHTLHRTNIGKHLTTSTKSSHTTKRNRITAMLLINGSVFFLCLIPFELVSIYAIIADAEDIPNRSHLRTWVDLCRITVYINSVINPFLYNAINPRYRLAFFKAFGIVCKTQTPNTTLMTHLNVNTINN
ncbi:neuropeptides B/W receptor type 2-like [Amphiura filiformis]|uniref:neuropeptides B/W receptor type 2-like n=1 Tax=Amphiura filiformis TaxID=82378 RepID=UPI003B20E3E0